MFSWPASCCLVCMTITLESSLSINKHSTILITGVESDNEHSDLKAESVSHTLQLKPLVVQLETNGRQLPFEHQ